MNITVTMPDGKSYQIEAPNVESAVEAYQRLAGGAEKGSSAPSSPVLSSGLVGSALDIPILGPAARGIEAATKAALGPTAEVPEPTLGERYHHHMQLLSRPLEEYRSEHPLAAGLANFGTTALATGGLASTATGARLLGLGGGPGVGIGGQFVRGIGSGAGINAVDAALRGQNPIEAALVGGALGGAGPIVVRGASAVAAPFISNLRARINPEGYARTQVARGLAESGLTAPDIEAGMAQAAREGQPQFTAADVMGVPGQRLLSTAYRGGPGDARTMIENAMEGRQVEQGRRVINQLQEGFGVGRETAEQAAARMKGELDAYGNAAYPAVRAAGVPVDVTPVIARIDQTLRPGVTGLLHPQTALAPDTIEGALAAVRARLTDGRSMLTDFTALQRVRDDISDAAMRAQRAGSGHLASKLGGVKNAIDTVMEAASPGWKAVNQEYAQRGLNMGQIAEGQTLGQRGRTEDIIRQFTAPMTETGRVTAPTPAGQQAFRVGYVDPLIRKAQDAAVGTNQARALSGVGFRDEAAALAPGNTRLQAQLAREMIMFETRAHALKGSATAQNIADAQSIGIDPAIIANLAHGNVTGAMHRMMGSVSATMNGNTPAVRAQIARILLADGRTPPGQFQAAVDQVARNIQTLQRRVRVGTRAATAAGAAQYDQGP